MRLTDSTNVRQLANGRVVVSVGTFPAIFVSPDDVFPCGDLYHGYPAWLADAQDDEDFDGWYPDSPSDLIQTCKALRVQFDNGSACTAGHTHFNDAEYFDDEEIEAARRGHFLLPSNARRA